MDPTSAQTDKGMYHFAGVLPNCTCVCAHVATLRLCLHVCARNPRHLCDSLQPWGCVDGGSALVERCECVNDCTLQSADRPHLSCCSSGAVCALQIYGNSSVAESLSDSPLLLLLLLTSLCIRPAPLPFSPTAHGPNMMLRFLCCTERGCVNQTKCCDR